MRSRFDERCSTIGVRSLYWFYSIYFALGMPFICWGAVATPGHPHRLPHFVFAPPTLSTTALSMEGQHTGNHANRIHQHGQTAPASNPNLPGQPTHSAAQPSDVAGRSTPAASAITLLTLIFVGVYWLQCIPQLLFVFKLGDLSERQFIPIPLTPPPRSFRLAQP